MSYCKKALKFQGLFLLLAFVEKQEKSGLSRD